MISSLASIISPSSATVKVEKATSALLNGPDWASNIYICETINSDTMLIKDVVKAVKKRVQHKNPKVQLLALTLLETMVKNCGDNVHYQIAERNIVQEMVKIVKKKTVLHVRDKILTLIASWNEEFGGPQGRYPQIYMAYEELRSSGVSFPRPLPDAAPVFTPPITHPMSRQPQAGYGMPSSSSTRLEPVASDGSLSLFSIRSMWSVLDLLADMLQAVDPHDRLVVRDDVIVDLVEQSRANQKKLMHMLNTTDFGDDEELLARGLELNDRMQMVLVKHDAIALGMLLPPEIENFTKEEMLLNREINPKSSKASIPSASTSNTKPSAPDFQANNVIVEDKVEEEEDDDEFTLLARRRSRTHKGNATTSEKPTSSIASNAIFPVDSLALTQEKDQDIADHLGLTLSTTEKTTPQNQMQPSADRKNPFSIGSYPKSPNQGSLASTGRVEPWARYSSSGYPPPPWATSLGSSSGQSSMPRETYADSSPKPAFSSDATQPQGLDSVNIAETKQAGNNRVQRPFIPSRRLFEDLDVFGKNDGSFKAGNSNAPSSAFPGSNHQGMVGERE